MIQHNVKGRVHGKEVYGTGREMERGREAVCGEIKTGF